MIFKISLMIGIITLFVNCKDNQKRRQPTDDNFLQIIEVDTTFKNILDYKKHEAIKRYGNPNFQERFILNDLQGEFRGEVAYNKYTLKERLRENILIDELTWEKDSVTWITVWYEVRKEFSVPKHKLEWDKGSEF